MSVQLISAIGFSGKVPRGLVVHPDQEHVLYPLGSTVVIKNIITGKQRFLQGHTDKVTCISVSHNGRLVASGQQTHQGFRADIILWDFAQGELLHRFNLHKVKVQNVAFSPSDIYLASLGGEDDGSVVVWDLKEAAAICGSPAARESAGNSLCLAFANQRDDVFITAGEYTLRVWELDLANRKIRPTDCQLGHLKRVINCIIVDSQDENMYCGTTTGDILEVKISTKLLKSQGPSKAPLTKGILSLAFTTNQTELIAGTGTGQVAVLKKSNLAVARTGELSGAVTSIGAHTDGNFFCGTEQSNIYLVSSSDLSATLFSTCHCERINFVEYPHDYSKLFGTCSVGDIRIWNVETGQELLNIKVPNLECNCVTFTKNGKYILSGMVLCGASGNVQGWSDGKIRAFGPQSGKLIYCINDAHQNGVTAVACTSDGSRIISGGVDGQIRVWNVKSNKTQVMEISMKEHKGTVTSIKMSKNDKECVSTSIDGSCIIWDLEKFVRRICLFAETMFRTVDYFPDESQILTGGTDKKIAYWDTFEGESLREIEAAANTINSIAVTRNGQHFVSGGADRSLKVWDYDKGKCLYQGIADSGSIVHLTLSPDQRTIVSVSDEGAIYLWRNPVYQE